MMHIDGFDRHYVLYHEFQLDGWKCIHNPWYYVSYAIRHEQIACEVINDLNENDISFVTSIRQKDYLNNAPSKIYIIISVDEVNEGLMGLCSYKMLPKLEDDNDPEAIFW